MIVSRRNFLARSAALGTIGAACAGGQFAAIAGAPEPDLSRVHPELRSLAEAIARHDAVTPRLSTASLAQARRTMSMVPPPLATVPWEMRNFPGAEGQPQVTAYLINAGADGQRPAIVHMHGGGFVTGTARTAIPGMQILARQLNCVIMTVEYRLAPETTWAGSVEDNYAALKWLHGNAGMLGVDPARIAVMGESAGGGHAAFLALTARDRGEIPVAFQCLTYPMLDDRTGSSRSVPAHVGTLMWMAADNRYAWGAFLGMRPGTASVPPRAVPARVDNLAGLPPAFIGVGSLDLFADESTEYARRLNDAGVAAELIVVPGAFHVFDGSPAPIAQWFSAAKLDALRRGLGIPLVVAA